MKKQLLNIVYLISICLLSSCGAENHSYGWEYDYKYNDMRIRGESNLTPGEIYAEYEKAVQCFGNKPPPFIIFTDDLIKHNCGKTKYSPPLILIKKVCGISQEYVIKHELVHYFGIRGHKKDFKVALKCLKR